MHALLSRSLVLASLLGFASVAAMSPQSNVSSSHQRYLVNDSSFNPGGYMWAARQWVVGNDAFFATQQQVTWCNNLSGYASEVATAFSDWESVLPGTQFSQTCSSPNISVSWGGTPFDSTTGCNNSSYACAQPNSPHCSNCWQYDSVRQTNYLSGIMLFLNPTVPFTWDGTKVLQTMRHEVGHFMGLHEHYLHTNPATCNPSAPSTVMDLAPSSYTGCGDGSVVTTADSTDVVSYFSNSAPSNLVAWDCSSYYGLRTLCINWLDNQPANSLIYMDFWLCSTSACTSRTWLGSTEHRPGAGFYGSGNSLHYNKGGTLVAGYYQATAYHYNAVTGLGSGVNTNAVLLP